MFENTARGGSSPRRAKTKRKREISARKKELDCPFGGKGKPQEAPKKKKKKRNKSINAEKRLFLPGPPREVYHSISKKTAKKIPAP